MNVSSEALAFPINHHHHRILTKTHSSMFVSASPVAVSNKIKAIQIRKPRITLPSYYDVTNIRPLRIGNPAGITSSSANFSNITPEKLFERSKELRLGRISTRQNPRPSVLSSTSTVNQQSLVWPNYNTPTVYTKQPHLNSSTTTPTAIGPPVNRLTTGHMPDIHQRSNRGYSTTRQPLTEQQNTVLPVAARRHKSLPKTKSSIPKAYHHGMSKSKSPFPLSHAHPLRISHDDYSKPRPTHPIHMYESEEDMENIPIMDEEFEEYLAKAIVKCADWLIQHVFDRKYDENDG